LLNKIRHNPLVKAHPGLEKFSSNLKRVVSKSPFSIASKGLTYWENELVQIKRKRKREVRVFIVDWGGEYETLLFMVNKYK
jgi:hypothetical protein